MGVSPVSCSHKKNNKSDKKNTSVSTSLMPVRHIQLWLCYYEKKTKNKKLYLQSNLPSMSINNCFALLWKKTHHRCSLLYHGLCKVYLSLCDYSRYLLWTGDASVRLSECSVGRFSCIAVGCDQKLISRVMTPPAQNNTCTQHAQHLYRCKG